MITYKSYLCGSILCLSCCIEISKTPPYVQYVAHFKFSTECLNRTKRGKRVVSIRVFFGIIFKFVFKHNLLISAIFFLKRASNINYYTSTKVTFFHNARHT
jgi:hypothetical protein